jgi:hypothetical protein
VIDELVECIFFLLLLGTNAAQEALCLKCTDGVCSSILLHGSCVCLAVCVLLSWVCAVLLVSFFSVSAHWLSVCLCVDFGYLIFVQKIVCPLILFAWICVIHILQCLTFWFDSLILIFRKEQVWVLSCGSASGSIVYFHSP